MESIWIRKKLYLSVITNNIMDAYYSHICAKDAMIRIAGVEGREEEQCAERGEGEEGDDRTTNAELSGVDLLLLCIETGEQMEELRR